MKIHTNRKALQKKMKKYTFSIILCSLESKQDTEDNTTEIHVDYAETC